MAQTKKHIKIAFDASPLLVNKTGIAYYIERLTAQLAKHSSNIELVGFYYNFLNKRSAKHFPKAPNIRYRPIRFIPGKVVYQLRRWGIEIPLELLIKERCDFVLFGNFLGYPSLYKTPSAPVVHDLTYLDLPEYVATKNRSDLTRFVPVQIQRGRFVITVSEFSKDKISRTYNVPPKNILVTPIPPAPLPAKALSPGEQSASLQDLGITKPYILFVGTIEPRKNVISLIDAYQQLPTALQEAYSFVITGRIGWNCEAEVARFKQAKEEGLDVLHLGYVSDEARDTLYASATMFTSASHYEGFGMPVLEAMQYGLASAVSDIAVFHEVAGDAALYFNQARPEAITKTWERLLTNNTYRQELAHKAKARALDAFSWERIAKDLLARIESELAKKT